MLGTIAHFINTAHFVVITLTADLVRPMFSQNVLGGNMQALFFIVITLFIIVSGLLVASVLLQEAKQSGLGDIGGGGGDFSTLGGVSGGLQRITVALGIIWGLLAIGLNIIPR
jgi:protein translocase SecG subunit